MALVDRWAPPAARVRLEGAGGLRAACSVCAAGAEGGVGDRPPGDAMMPGVSTKELGEAAATRLSSSQPGGGGTARALNRGGSLEDTVKQQAATIHAQALKLSQLQVRPPALPAPRGVPGVARAGPAGGAGRRAGRRVTRRARSASRRACWTLRSSKSPRRTSRTRSGCGSSRRSSRSKTRPTRT